MLTAVRALFQSVGSAPELPRVEAFRDLYGKGFKPRQGQLIMVAGRSGQQKSGFALFWMDQINLPTLYLSADMTAFEASVRLAEMRLGKTEEEVEDLMTSPEGEAQVEEALASSNITFSFGTPITWPSIDDELEAWVELNDSYPSVIVIDNLMDIENCESDYTAQMEAMQFLTSLARETGSTVLVLHHATDKSKDAVVNHTMPPARSEIKGGMAEKPQLSLTVALDPRSFEYRVAVVKQRGGPCDPSAQSFVTLRADPARTRFMTYN